MNKNPLLPLALLLAAGGTLSAQTVDQFLARLDQASAAFTGAKAEMRRTSYIASIGQDEVENGSILVRKAGPGKLESRLDITGDNATSYLFRGDSAEHYLPGLSLIEIWDMRKYRGLAQTLLALGFGTSGKELKANYVVSNLRKETAGGKAASAVDLAPKSADLIDTVHLKKAELWIADSDAAPVRLKLTFTDRNTWTVDYSNVQLNLKLSSGALDLPKSARREKRN